MHVEPPLFTAVPMHDIDLDDPWMRQVLRQCLQDLAGYPAAALPELAFRLPQQRLLDAVPTAPAAPAVTSVSGSDEPGGKVTNKRSGPGYVVATCAPPSFPWGTCDSMRYL